MPVKSAALIIAAVLVLGSCAETDLDPKVRWGAGLKGIMGTVHFASESTPKGPLDTICGSTTDFPLNCVAECPAVDPATGWFLSANLICANQVPGTPGAPASGLWEATCGVFKEGLQAGQDEGTSHILNFTVTKPTRASAGSISLRFDMKGDTFIMPFAIDKVWVDGIYFFSKALTSAATSTFTAADMALTCADNSKVGVDMIKIDCQKFKDTYYDSVSCS